ncbi:MAG TPA: hypothetical protein VKC17_10285 [Sphingomicrobium sp.]|nr:hypothetical protein [Sphingomicrobium sp.]
MRKIAILLFLACSGPACAEAAQSQGLYDARADEAVSIFEKYCVVNGGTREEAEKLIAGSAIAKPLPTNVVSDLQSGRKGGIAWLIATPHKGQLILAYDPIGVCEVAVVAADGGAMHRAFGSMIDHAKYQLEVQVKGGEAQISKAHGSEIVAEPYSFPFLGKTATLTLTTADKTMPIGFQHTMTSTFTQPAKVK